MTLCFEIEFFDTLAVIDGFRVNLRVAQHYTLPDGLVSLLKSQVQELLVFNCPEGLFSLDLLTKFTLK